MSCSLNLRTQGLTGADTGGTWEYNGYNSNNASGPFGAGGTSPGTLTGDNASIDFSGYTPGFYSFTYSGGQGDCADHVELVIAVTPSVNAGCDAEIQICQGEGTTQSLLTLKNEECNEDINDVNLTITLDDQGDDPGSAYNAGAGTINLAALDPGIYIFEFKKEVTVPDGYDLSNCPNCDPSFATLTIEVLLSFDAGTANNIAVCN